MKRVLCGVVLSLLAAGCGGEARPDTDGGVDGGLEVGADAGDGQAPDGGEAGDAGELPPDAGSFVSLLAYQSDSSGLRAPGLEFLSLAVDGGYVSSGTTDPDGGAHIEIEPGGMVIVEHYALEGGERGLFAWVGVRPGESLRLGSPSSFQAGYERVATVTLRPPAATITGATRYWVDLGGTGRSFTPGTDFTVDIPRRVLGSDGTFSVQLIALDADSNILAYVNGIRLQPEDGAAFTLSDWETTFAPLSMELVDAPADITEARLSVNGGVGGIFFGGPRATAPVNEGSAALGLDSYTGEGLQYVYGISAGTASSGSTSVHFHVTELPGSKVVMDGDTDLLAIPNILSVDASGATWEVDGGMPADYFWATYTFDTTTWYVALPGGARALRLPPLPPDFASWAPTPTSSGFELILEGHESNAWTGFDDVRPDAFTHSLQRPAPGTILRNSQARR